MKDLILIKAKYGTIVHYNVFKMNREEIDNTFHKYYIFRTASFSVKNFVGVRINEIQGIL